MVATLALTVDILLVASFGGVGVDAGHTPTA